MYLWVKFLTLKCGFISRIEPRAIGRILALDLIYDLDDISAVVINFFHVPFLKP